MKLVRNTQTNGTCKYALIRLDKMRKDGVFRSIPDFIDKYPELENYVEFGRPHSKEEFFVIKFKDLASTQTLITYAEEAKRLGDEEFSNEIIELLSRTGENHEQAKIADTDINNYVNTESLDIVNKVLEEAYNDNIITGEMERILKERFKKLVIEIKPTNEEEIKDNDWKCL